MDILSPWVKDEIRLRKIDSLFKKKTLSPGSYFCKIGEKTGEIGLLEKGLLKSEYSIDEEKTIISRFFYPQANPIVTSFESFKQDMESRENIIAIENSEIWCISKKDLYNLYKTFPISNEIGRDYAEASYLRALKKIHQLQSMGSQELLDIFMRENPGLYNKLSKKDIASYLGISERQFSRLKK